MITEEKRLADILEVGMFNVMTNKMPNEKWCSAKEASIVAAKFIIDDIERTIYHLDDENMLILLQNQKERYSKVLKEIEER